MVHNLWIVGFEQISQSCAGGTRELVSFKIAERVTLNLTRLKIFKLFVKVTYFLGSRNYNQNIFSLNKIRLIKLHWSQKSKLTLPFFDITKIKFSQETIIICFRGTSDLDSAIDNLQMLDMVCFVMHI